MGDLSENFSRHEFACKCGCGHDTVDAELLDILEKIREHFGRRMDINSGCRCHMHNRAIGGAPESWHIRGRAADVEVDGIKPSLVAEAAVQYGASGVKNYSEWTHIDTRTGHHWRE